MRSMWRVFAMVMTMLLVPALCAGAGVLPPGRDYYYAEDGAVAARPAITGTFLQPWLCQGWTDSQWDRHLDMLLSAGIDKVIVQWTAETPDGELSYAGFPVPDDWPRSSGGLNHDPNMVERLLKSAEARHVKVFLGLNTAEEWWGNAFLQPEWCAKQAETGNRIAARLYDLYKARYPNAFHGWYWPWEMYGNTSGFEKHWSELMNANLDYLTELDDSLPVLFSPFLSGYIRPTPGQEEKMWAGFFASARLRDGDIFCPQDSAGAAGFTMQYIDGHLAAMKRAADIRPGLLFWVNNENFTKDFQPAGLDRFVSQLYVSARYAGDHVCFSYSHYYDPGLVNPSFDRAYQVYLGTGQIDRTPPAPPELSVKASDDGRAVTLSVTPADATDCHVIKVYRGSRLIGEQAVVAAAPVGFTMEDRPGIAARREYFATVTDCWGNVSPRTRVVLED